MYIYIYIYEYVCVYIHIVWANHIQFKKFKISKSKSAEHA